MRRTGSNEIIQIAQGPMRAKSPGFVPLQSTPLCTSLFLDHISGAAPHVLSVAWTDLSLLSLWRA